jgi:hypothetical protein
LDKQFALAVLCYKSRAIGWREFDGTSGEVGTAVKKAVVGLLTYARKSLSFDTPKAVRLEGKAPDVNKAAALLEEMGLRVEVREGSVSLGRDASLGVALAGLDGSPEACDLARSLRPPPRLRDLVPWGDLALAGAMLFVLWVVMNGHFLHLHRSLGRTLAETLRKPEIRNCSDEELKSQCSALASQVRAFNKFSDERETWGKYLAALPAWLPRQAHLVDMQGQAPLPVQKHGEAGKTDSQRSLLLTCAADLGSRGSAPAEVDQFVESLRSQKLLKRFFPTVELANVRWRKEGNTGRALFTVACLPQRKFKTIAHEPEAEPETPERKH